MSITVFICDDHAVVRDGLRFMLEAQGNIKVIGEASNGREAVKKVKELKPDIVIMDIVMAELNGIDATEQICKENPSTRVIMLHVSEKPIRSSPSNSSRMRLRFAVVASSMK